jgi:hypothetical protein
MAYLFEGDGDYTQWSACSYRVYAHNFGNAATLESEFSCLSTGSTAVCGNGVLEKGEGQGLTLVHCSAQCERFLWDRRCV